MNAQEQQLIDELVNRIRTTALQNKDLEAEQHLQQGLANSPDALYILAQTVIVQKYGLEQAQQRLGTMQTELDTLRDQAAQTQAASRPSGGSFLGNLFGSSSSAPQPPAAPLQQGGWQAVTNPGYPQAGYAPAPGGYPPGAYPTPGYAQSGGWGGATLGGGGGGFLHNALQTAAGVAMGEMAVQSVESLFHGFGGGGGYGRGFEGGRPSETIINNYEDGDSPRHERDDSVRDRDDDRSFYNPGHDASRDSDTHAFADTDPDDTDRDDNDSNSDDADDSSDFDSGDDSGDSSSGDDDSN